MRACDFERERWLVAVPPRTVTLTLLFVGGEIHLGGRVSSRVPQRGGIGMIGST